MTRTKQHPMSLTQRRQTPFWLRLRPTTTTTIAARRTSLQTVPSLARQLVSAAHGMRLSVDETNELQTVLDRYLTQHIASPLARQQYAARTMQLVHEVNLARRMR